MTMAHTRSTHFIAASVGLCCGIGVGWGGLVGSVEEAGGWPPMRRYERLAHPPTRC